MNTKPANDKLTPKQVRFFIAAFLLFTLIFAGIGGSIAWKTGNSEETAAERAYQQRLQQSIKLGLARAKDFKEELAQSRAATAKKVQKVKKMPIARIERGKTSTIQLLIYESGSGAYYGNGSGTTEAAAIAQAEFWYNENAPGDSLVSTWYLDHGSEFWGFGYPPDPATKGGFEVSPHPLPRLRSDYDPYDYTPVLKDISITIPADAPLGTYGIHLDSYTSSRKGPINITVYKDENDNDVYVADIQRLHVTSHHPDQQTEQFFEVVEGCPVVIQHNAQFHGNEGNTTDNYYPFGSVIPYASAYEGDPPNRTFLPVRVDVDWGDGANTADWPANINPNGGPGHTYAQPGTYTVTMTLTAVGSCTKVVTVVGQVTILPRNCNFTLGITGGSNISVLKGYGATFTFFLNARDSEVNSGTLNVAKQVALSIDWGNGSSTQQNTSTVYDGSKSIELIKSWPAAGVYTVTVGMTSVNCPDVSTSMQFQVTVTDPPWSGAGWYCVDQECVEFTSEAAWQAAGSPTNGPHPSENQCYNVGECATDPNPRYYYFCTQNGVDKATTPLQDASNWDTLEEAQDHCSFPGPGYYCVNGVCSYFANSNSWVPAGKPTPKYTSDNCAGLCGGGGGGFCQMQMFVSDDPDNDRIKVVIDSNYNIPVVYASGFQPPAGQYPLPESEYPNYYFERAEGYWSFVAIYQQEGGGDCVATQDILIQPKPVDPCNYEEQVITVYPDAGDGYIKCFTPTQSVDGWLPVITYTLNGVTQTKPQLDILPQYNAILWQVSRTVGTHNFLISWTKPGCIGHIIEKQVIVGPGGGGGGGGGGGTPCPPCPPDPDPYVCAPTVEIISPTSGAELHNFARIRIKVKDANEETNICHPNYGRPFNHEADGPAIQLRIGTYLLPVTWKLLVGTPLNGTYEALVDTRDYANGNRPLRVSVRGVGGCRVEAFNEVLLNNTLQSNIFYRDTFCAVQMGFVIGDACIGIETRALSENTSRRYWMQTGVRSGTSLDGPYQHADWVKHQMVKLELGAQWGASEDRFERHNWHTHVTFKLPLSREIRVRRKWTPQFYLSCYDMDAERVEKIREIEPGVHYIFTTTPARVWRYDGNKLEILGDFAVTPTIDEDELGDDEDPEDFDFIDREGSNIFAPTASDVAVYSGDATGQKVYVIVPPSQSTPEFPRGEVFAYDPDTDEKATEYGIRRENRIPKFLEVVGNKVICIYVYEPDATTPVATKLSRGYDLTFATPKLIWQLPAAVTFSTIDAGVQYLACGKKLYSSNGTGTPSLIGTFLNNVTAASTSFVALDNGDLFKKNGTTNSWDKVQTQPESIMGVRSWTTGIEGESQTARLRGIFGGTGPWLSGERQNGTWYEDVELRAPLDVSSETVDSVTTMDHFSKDIATVTAGEGEVAPLPQKDERILVGAYTNDSDPKGLLFIYQRSALSESDGAIPVSHDAAPRIFPLPKRAVTV